jgi:hypothetical protein
VAGKQVTNFGNQDDANAVALQSDGKIVLAGIRFATDGSSDFALARYLGNRTSSRRVEGSNPSPSAS